MVEKLIGIEKQLEEIRQFIVNFSPQAKKYLLLYGPPGVGKTSSVHFVAKELGYELAEYNSSDLRNSDFTSFLLPHVISKPFIPTLFFFDEIDGFEDFDGLIKLLSHSANPIIMAANNINSIPQKVRLWCKEIYFPPPSINDVVGLVKEKGGGKVNFHNVPKDFRQANNIALGSQGYSEEDYFAIVKKILYGEEVSDKIEKPHLYTLLDNAFSFFSGYDLFLFLKALSIAGRTGRAIVFSDIKPKRRSAEIKPSHFFLRKREIEKSESEV